DQTAVDFLAVVGLVALADILFRDMDPVAAELREQQPRFYGVFFPFVDGFIVRLQDFGFEVLGGGFELLKRVGEFSLDLGGSDVDSLFLARKLDNPPVDKVAEPLGSLARDQVLAKLFAGKRNGIVDVSDDALGVLRYRSRWGGSGRLGQRSLTR